MISGRYEKTTEEKNLLHINLYIKKNTIHVSSYTEDTLAEEDK